MTFANDGTSSSRSMGWNDCKAKTKKAYVSPTVITMAAACHPGDSLGQDVCLVITNLIFYGEEFLTLTIN